jgi:ABC-type uncharacterized transport system substrate-binding protein
MTIRRLALAACLLVAFVTRAAAHPHVWVTARSELVYGADGRLSGVRHAWTFDDMFSSYATQGLDVNGDGKFTREELAPLAETNVTSLKEFKFFTFGKYRDKRVAFSEPTDYWLEQVDGLLILHFTLPVKDGAPDKGEAFKVEVYDPTYFVEFQFAKDESAAKVVSAPPGCAVELDRPKAPDATQSKKLSESFFSGLSPGSNFGAQFSNTLFVTCK